jgi:hypothetical protein
VTGWGHVHQIQWEIHETAITKQPKPKDGALALQLFLVIVSNFDIQTFQLMNLASNILWRNNPLLGNGSVSIAWKPPRCYVPSR